MNPECRPITFSKPMPLLAPVASTWALRMASAAAAAALSKPKLRSMKWMSLSIVFGIPTTEIDSFRRSISATSLVAPRKVPSPPMTNSAPMPHLLQLIDHLAGILAPPRGAEDGSAQVMDGPDHRWSEPHRFVAEARDDPFEAVAKTEDLLDAVGVRQLEDHPAHDVVDAGTEPAAGHDPDPELGRIEEDAVAWARQLERRQLRKAGGAGGHHPGGAIVEQDPIRLADVVHDPVSQPRDQRRPVATGAERLDLEVDGLDALRPLGDGQLFGAPLDLGGRRLTDTHGEPAPAPPAAAPGTSAGTCRIWSVSMIVSCASALVMTTCQLPTLHHCRRRR